MHVYDGTTARVSGDGEVTFLMDDVTPLLTLQLSIRGVVTVSVNGSRIQFFIDYIRLVTE